MGYEKGIPWSRALTGRNCENLEAATINIVHAQEAVDK